MRTYNDGFVEIRDVVTSCILPPTLVVETPKLPAGGGPNESRQAGRCRAGTNGGAGDRHGRRASRRHVIYDIIAGSHCYAFA